MTGDEKATLNGHNNYSRSTSHTTLCRSAAASMTFDTQLGLARRRRNSQSMLPLGILSPT